MLYLLKSFVFLFCIVLNIFAKTVNLDNLTFDLIAKMIYENNPDIKSAKYSKFSADEAIAQSFSEYYPNIMLRLYHGFERSNESRRNELSEKLDKSHNSQIAITLSQNIYNGLGTKYRLKHSKCRVDSVLYRYFSKEQEVFLKAFKAFIDIWGARQYIANAQKMQDNLKEVLAARKMQLDSGEIKVQDYASVESALYTSKARVIGAMASLKTAIAELESLVLVKLEGNCDLPNDFSCYVPKDVKEFILKATQANPQLIAKKHAVSAAKEYLRFEYSQFAPKIDIDAQIAKRWGHKNRNGSTFMRGYYEGTSRDDYQDTTYVSLSMKIPLWQNSGRNISARVRMANAEQEKAEQEYMAIVNNLQSECKRVWNEYFAAVEQVKQSEEAVRAATVASDGYKASEILGVESSTDVIYNENKLLEAQDKFITAKVAQWKSMLEMQYFMGKINKNYLKHTSNRAEMTSNAQKVKCAPIKF